ncbi:hypothetical protein AB0B45_18370 [Nonomuraea sp. NPDC049152]|uniref:hypothetical protein n=1 Tax=Nonomuraea sp. NPDC049152 TaxID=3154350 RepID=UPI0033F9A5E6
MVITADALHTQHTHAQQIAAADGYYPFIVKGDQPTLLNRPKALPWREAILNDRTDDNRHGRRARPARQKEDILAEAGAARSRRASIQVSARSAVA